LILSGKEKANRSQLGENLVRVELSTTFTTVVQTSQVRLEAAEAAGRKQNDKIATKAKM
jgi:hypothetical protein